MRYDDDRIELLERAMDELRARVARLEAPRLATPATAAAPLPRATPVGPQVAPGPAASPRRPSPPRMPSLDIEELLGGRILAWAGGLAVLAGVVFFLATALRRGWIDVPTRITLAYLGSSALLALGLYLFERKGKTQASRALVAAAIGALFASTTAATSLYGLLDPALGLLVAALVGTVAAVVAVRWDSREIAAIGIVGALASPVLVGADASWAALGFVAIALGAATGVLLWRRWDWLAVAAFVTSTPQLLGWLNDNRGDSVLMSLAVVAAFWMLYALAAIGFELRVPTERLRFSSASLVLANAILVAAAGWLLLADADHPDWATAWVVGVAAVHVALGSATLRGRISKEIALLLLAVGLGLAAIGAALALEGPALVAAWSVEAVLLAWLGARLGRARGFVAAAGFLAASAAHTLLLDAPPYELGAAPSLTSVVAVALVTAAALAVGRIYDGPWTRYRHVVTVLGLAGLAYLVPTALDGVWVVAGWSVLAVGLAWLSERRRFGVSAAAPAPFVALTAAHTLLLEAPPQALRDGVDDLLPAALAIALTTAGALLAASFSPDPFRRAFGVVGAVGAVYLPSVVIVDATAGGALEPGQTPQVLLSVFWSTVGLTAVVLGLAQGARQLRLAGLGLLALAAAKVALYDLAELDEIYRVLSFVALGLLLLGGAFAYQRTRHDTEAPA